MIILDQLLPPLLFFIIPTLIGCIPYHLLMGKKDYPYPLVTSFILGSLTLFTTALFVQYILPFVFTTASFGSIFFPLIILYVLVSILWLIKYGLDNLNEIGNSRVNTRPFVWAVLLALVAYILWMQNSPYPLNWDMYEHQLLINIISGGKFNFFTSRLSDTFGFDGYPTFFHLLTASAQHFFTISINSFWNNMGFIHLITTILASYYFVKAVTGNKTIAFISSLFGAFIFESSVAYTSLFFIPQTFTAVIAVFAYSQLFTQWNKGKTTPVRLILLQSIFLILSHFIIGTVAVFIYLFLYAYTQLSHKIDLFQTHLPIIELFVLSLIGIVVLSNLVPLGFINQGEAAFYTFDLSTKVEVMRNSYGFSLIFFLPLGIVYALKRGKQSEMISFLILFGFLAVILSQFPYVLKLFVIGRFFVHLFMALGFYLLWQHMRYKILRIVSVGILALSLLAIYIVNISYWKDILQYQNLQTHVSVNEMLAADFLRKNYGDGYLLISDPATQYILEAYSSINSQGGAYMDEQSRKALAAFSQTTNPLFMSHEAERIQDHISSDQKAKKLIILSGRYFLWREAELTKKMAFYYNIWAPQDLTLNNLRLIESLTSNSAYFEKVYQNNSLAVFRLK